MRVFTLGLARVEGDAQRSRTTGLERGGDAAALDGEVLVRHHLGSEHRGEDAVVSEHDGLGHPATEEHLGELD